MKKLLVICGATASGKTALAVECAKRLGGEVVSCDALLVYRGLNIGTAKPTKEERAGIPHHLIDVADPTDSFTVHDYERLSLAAIEDISARGKVPVICGGTGFYLNAVLFRSGFGNAAADEGVRAKYQAIAEEKRDEKIARFAYEAFAFDFPRGELYARIDRRVEEMFEAGLVGEVEGLLAAGVPEDAQCMQGIGYKEVIEGLKSGYLHSTMRDIIQKNTRNYAKRQLTFFKKLPNLHWLDPSCAAIEEVIELYDR